MFYYIEKSGINQEGITFYRVNKISTKNWWKIEIPIVLSRLYFCCAGQTELLTLKKEAIKSNDDKKERDIKRNLFDKHRSKISHSIMFLTLFLIDNELIKTATT